jgi:glycerol-3-phosphate dehydrogenase (NAD(P)+)
MSRIGVIGSGSWGLALSNVLSDNNHEVIVYTREASDRDLINHTHSHPLYFNENVIINDSITVTCDLSELDDCETIVLSVPSVAVEDVCIHINDVFTSPKIFVNTAKGFNPSNFELLTDTISSTITPYLLKDLVSLIGPSHAEEVVIRLLTSVNVVGLNDETLVYIQQLFSNSYFRVYRNHDVIGAQLGVATKNVIALASGMLNGFGLADNAKAALITRGLAEMSRLGLAMGGKLETFLGLCGVGDLVVTATSVHSRNFQAGYRIGKDNDASTFLATNQKTVEGIYALAGVLHYARLHNVEMPICEAVNRIIHNHELVSDVIQTLTERDLKREFE